MKALLSAVVAIVICNAASQVWALSTETFGNESLWAANYADWPGVLPLINNRNRVYQDWVNGNEHFCYSGDATAANEASTQFAAIESKPLQIVLRPGPGQTHAFEPQKMIPCDLSLNLVGGIALGITTLDKEPTLTIYISKALPVEKLIIPAGVSVVTIPELKDRSAELLKSSDKTTRGWGAGKLARLDVYDTRSMDAIATLLKDDDTWVRSNAVGALSVFGAKAKSKLDDLRIAAQTGNEGINKEIAKRIGEIEKAPGQMEAERDHRRILERIDLFVELHRNRK